MLRVDREPSVMWVEQSVMINYSVAHTISRREGASFADSFCNHATGDAIAGVGVCCRRVERVRLGLRGKLAKAKLMTCVRSAAIATDMSASRRQSDHCGGEQEEFRMKRNETEIEQSSGVE